MGFFDHLFIYPAGFGGRENDPRIIDGKILGDF